ncbi:MAG: Rrf2 family transcriptional regulator [Intestinibacter sp.]|uniref:Rrf2 family transcriptional regulator n=1 Tax=Intestinibacter sp. TaxID=1965304 RepID=UPI002A8313F3|nr:Rrf2 family transcriptional regulator [Intestinibacter sp.]MDY4575857.1 Rrf2 family transcriptional regulator [Intestinibacter sp.]
MFGSLKKAGIINVRRGHAGAELAMNPSEITLFDIYNAVDPNSLENLIGIHKNPSPECPVGCKIHEVLVRVKAAAVNPLEILMRPIIKFAYRSKQKFC